MKRRGCMLIFGLMLAISCLICAVVGWQVRTMHGSGRIIVEERLVRDFTGVNLLTFGNLYIEQGDQELLRIEAEDNLIPYLESTVNDGILEIKMAEAIFLHPTRPINFYLTVKELDTVILSGSGYIKVSGLDAERVSLIVYGSGDVETGMLQADTVNIQITGSGDVRVAGGKADRQRVAISGSGNYLARNLASVEAAVQISGSGSTMIQANDRLDASISGSGKVRYVGNPAIEKMVTGSGEVRRVDG